MTRQDKNTWRPRSNVRRDLHLLLILLCPILCLPRPMVWAGGNETPKKKNAIYYSILWSTGGFADKFKVPIMAEKYSYSTIRFDQGSKPSLTKLKELGTNKDYAVLILATHASADGMVVEVFDNVDSRDRALKAYKKDKNFKEIANALGADTAKDTIILPGGDERSGHRPAIGISKAGLEKLFGGPDGNRTILVLAGCESFKLTNGTNPFGNTEVVGFTVCVKAGQLISGVMRGFLRMGGSDCISNRPVKPAFSFVSTDHIGPGNTTLAPAVTDHTPVNDVVLPLDEDTPGSTDYDTKMLAANTAIMEASGCDASIANEMWTAILDGASERHTFTVRPTTKGRLVLKVKPDQAVSRNNERCLIGNKYIYKFMEANFEIVRQEINECQFGKTGLDSLSAPPPLDPYRWCVWCGEKPNPPIDPPEKSKTPKDIESSIVPQNVPWGETHAFVLFQGDPQFGSVLTATGSDIPPEFSFVQVSDWYAHVIFTPTMDQPGLTFDVLFESSDDGGLRNSQETTFTVVDRVDQVTLYEASADSSVRPIETRVGSPGDSASYTLALINNGNTILENPSVVSGGFLGPDLIPDGAMTIEPSVLPLLQPGQVEFVQVTIDTPQFVAAGDYVGQIQFNAETAIGPLSQTLEIPFVLDHPPVIFTPGSVQIVAVGDEIVIPMEGSDEDGDPVIYTMLRGPAGATLEVAGEVARQLTEQVGELLFTWAPGPKDTGYRSIPLEADDGQLTAAYALEFQVEGPVNVNVLSLQDNFFAEEPLPIEIWYWNRNDVTAEVFETLEVFAHDLDGELLFSTGEVSLGLLVADEELVRPIDIPPLGVNPALLVIRVTARSIVNANEYTDTSDFSIIDLNAIPTVSQWGLVVFTLCILGAGMFVLRRRRSVLA